jgi:hypothetical protein
MRRLTSMNVKTLTAVVMACGLAVPVAVADPSGTNAVATGQGGRALTKGAAMARKEATSNAPPMNADITQNPGVPLPEGSPLVFDTTYHDFGKIPDTTPVSFDFKFRNTSNRTVKILKVTASCGCTTTKAKTEIAPGEESVITATFNPQGRSGREVKSITLDLDDPVVKNIFLTAGAFVQRRIMVEPQALFMGEVPRGKGAVQEITISGREPGFEITSARLESPVFSLEKIGKDEVEVEGDKLQRFRYRVTLKPDAPTGNTQAQISLTTNDDKQGALQVSVMANVVGPIRTSPERLAVRYAGPGQPWVSEVTMEPRDAGTFKVLGVSVDDSASTMNVVLDLLPGRPGTRQAYRLRVSGTTPAEIAQVQGGVRIKTDNPEQAEIVVPFMALQMAPAPTPSQPSMQGGATVVPANNGSPAGKAGGN